MFWFFGHKSSGILAPQFGIEFTLLTWKAKSQLLDPQGSPRKRVLNINVSTSWHYLSY